MIQRGHSCDDEGAAEALLIAALDEYLTRIQAGERVCPETFAAQYPELGGSLVEYLHSLAFVQRAAGEQTVGRTPLWSNAAEREAVWGEAGSWEAEQADASGLESNTRGECLSRALGDFELVREIGRGGMGVVYEAVQRSLDRRVALKVLPFAAFLDPRQVARFEIEAQTAAQLHHPNIVPVHSLEQEAGVRFYSMPLIDGESLDRVLDRWRRPGVGLAEKGARHRQVAEWGIQAAKALHHAHEFGVIHRDIKPSNLLVDSRGNLWITDFGLARWRPKAELSQTGAVLGTARYMSPEQAAGKSYLVDHRTDIYSLGATLFEMITARPLFPGSDREQVLRQVVADDPASPRRIEPAVPVDLETIILKALSKSRGQRYENGLQLADDLQRFLDGRPIAARRPTLVDRLAKWGLRHRQAVVASGVVLALIAMVGLIAAIAIGRAYAMTSAALARSDAHYRQAREIVDHFGVLLVDRLASTPGNEAVCRELLAETLGYYSAFIQQNADDPELHLDLALAHFKSGEIQEQLGLDEAAQAAYRAAWAAAGSENRGSDNGGSAQVAGDPSSELVAALARARLANLAARRGEEVAGLMFQEAISRLEQLHRQGDHQHSHARHLALTRTQQGMWLAKSGRVADAEQAYRAAAQLQRELLELAPDDPTLGPDLAMTLNNHGHLLRKSDPAQALTMVAESRRLLLHGKTSKEVRSARHLADLVLVQSNLALLQSQQGDLAGAESAAEEAVALGLRRVQLSPDLPAARRDLAVSYNDLGRVHVLRRDFVAAQRAFQAASRVLEQLLKEQPLSPHYLASLGAVLQNLGHATARGGNEREAADCFRQAKSLLRSARDESASLVMFDEIMPAEETP